jgi:hypothetical protein
MLQANQFMLFSQNHKPLKSGGLERKKNRALEVVPSESVKKAPFSI